MQVSKATARRATLHTGEAVLAEWEAEVERLKQERPQVPVGAEKQALSGDGAFVHLVGGEWDAEHRGGHAQQARGCVYAAALVLLASG